MFLGPNYGFLVATYCKGMIHTPAEALPGGLCCDEEASESLLPYLLLTRAPEDRGTKYLHQRIQPWALTAC